MEKLNEKVREFAEIAKTLPENLQAVCFELLLRDHLEALRPGSAGEKSKAGTPAASTKEQVDNVIEVSAADTSNQEDFKLTDLHVKVRKFLGKYNLSIEHINNVFFQEAKEVKPLYDDLKTTKTSESQIRVTLLLALRKAIRTGEFDAETTVVKRNAANASATT
jgi:hypothetical protein